MDTRNPVLARMEASAKRNGGYAGFDGAAPSTTGTIPGAPQGAASQPPSGTATYPVPVGQPPASPALAGRVMALPDVIAKTFFMFAVMLPVAVVAWMWNASIGVYFIAMFVALGLGIWASVKRVPSPPLFLLYAVAEGVVLGGISKIYNQWAIQNGWEQGIVGTAIVGTLIVFVLMLVLYSTRIIKVTGTFARMFLIGIVSYLILSFGSLILGMFGVGNGLGVFGMGWIGIAVSGIGVALASFSLVMDFAAIEQMVAARVPENESWRAAFGLVVTLVWLYLELLRLMALVANQNR